MQATSCQADHIGLDELRLFSTAYRIYSLRKDATYCSALILSIVKLPVRSLRIIESTTWRLTPNIPATSGILRLFRRTRLLILSRSAVLRSFFLSSLRLLDWQNPSYPTEQSSSCLVFLAYLDFLFKLIPAAAS